MGGSMDEQNHSERVTKQWKENVVCVCEEGRGGGIRTWPVVCTVIHMVVTSRPGLKELLYVQYSGWIDEWVDGRTDGRTGGRADGRTDGRADMEILEN